MTMITPGYLHLCILLRKSAIINPILKQTAVHSREQMKDLDLFEQTIKKQVSLEGKKSSA